MADADFWTVQIDIPFDTKALLTDTFFSYELICMSSYNLLATIAPSLWMWRKGC